MTVVWSGRGFLSAIVMVITFFISISILPKEYADYAFIITAFVTGIFSWIYGFKWNKEKIIVDRETGQSFKKRNKHTLFWIPMQYWGIIFPVFGSIILFQNSVIGGFITTTITAIAVYMKFGKNIINKSKTKDIVTNPNVSKFQSNRNKQASPKDEVKEKIIKKVELGTTKKWWKEQSEMTKEEMELYHKKYMPK